MKKFNVKLLVVFAIILVCLIQCRNHEKEVNMQPYAGYPLLADPDSVRQELASHCFDTINFRNGQVIADIGAGNGYLEGMLSLFHDSLTFYIQDIDTSICNASSVNRVAEFYKNLKKEAFNNKFIAVNGTDSSSNLPDNICDKILMISTYQYIKNPRPFIRDLRKKLKDDGLFYVINPQYGDYDDLERQRKEYGWNASPLETEISDIINCGFELINISRKITDGNSNDPYFMIFKKRER
jgi:SAM-dependent methyltransferase